MVVNRDAKFQIGQVVRHRFYPFRGVVVDVDPTFSNTEEWWNSIPEDVRPQKDQPYYHLLAENATSHYTAYVSEQNLLSDETGDPIRGVKLRIRLPNGQTAEYTTRPDGMIEVDGIDPGTCDIMKMTDDQALEVVSVE